MNINRRAQQILREARQNIETEEQWYKGTSSRFSPPQMCARQAISSTISLMYVGTTIAQENAIYDAGTLAMRTLYRTMFPKATDAHSRPLYAIKSDIHYCNDHRDRTHADILRYFDEAIAALEPQQEVTA